MAHGQKIGTALRAGTALCLGLALAWLLAACSTPAPRVVKNDALWAKARVVAVAPLANLTTHYKAGLIAAELAAAELRALKRFEVIGPQAVVSRLNLDELAVNDGLDLSRPAELGRRLGANTLLTGTVNEFRYLYGLYDQPTVGLTLRLVDLKTGQVVWEAVHSAGEASYWPSKMTLNQLAARVCAEMIGTLGSE